MRSDPFDRVVVFLAVFVLTLVRYWVE